MDNVNALRSIAEMPINLSVEQIGALQAGIKALQEQAERENGCEYCDPEVMSGNPIFSRHADGYLGNGKFCTDAGVGVKAYFCPREVIGNIYDNPELLQEG